MAEPTSALTFQDLIITVARKAGTAYYGAGGDEAAQAPTDTFDLAEAKTFVNDGIRMLISDAPPDGWRWARPVASVDMWPDVAVDATVTATGVYTTVTTITATEATFYPSMEGKTIIVTGVGSYTIVSYTSSTVITIAGDNAFAGKTFSIANDGAYTLPQTFGGQYRGDIQYAAETGVSVSPTWTAESYIRALRAESTVQTDTPYLFAVRKMSLARRWELVVYPEASGLETVEFPYDLHFDELSGLTDMHPAGYPFDEAVKAACLAVWERDGDDVIAGLNDYYQNKALPNAFKINARSAPQRLGYCGNPSRSNRTLRNFRNFQNRPTVTYDTP